MSTEFNALIKSFDTAIKHKEDGEFSKADVDDIYEKAQEAFSDMRPLDQQQVSQVRDRLVKLAEGFIDKGRATKKLQGTSRAEAIRSVLNNMLK